MCAAASDVAPSCACSRPCCVVLRRAETSQVHHARGAGLSKHRCKKRIYVFFILVTFFYVCNVFYFPKVFIFKNVGKVQSGKQIHEKHFQNNSKETDV